jgi:peptide deformylase
MELIDPSNPILRQKASQIQAFDQKLAIFVNELFGKLETMEGVGLAAPQIGTSLAVAVIEYTRKKEDDPKEVKDIPKMALINPKVIWCSKDKELQTEACFSLPKEEVDVLRHKKIHIEYQDVSGKRKKLKAKGFLARALQHEIDHLNGILIIDYK